MITAAQLVAHAVGDYVIQSDWMALEKTKRHLPAALHALTYGLPFLLFRPSVAAFSVIVGTHFVIDRWRLARYVVWAKNQAAPAEYRYPFHAGSKTGYPDTRPAWMTVWLLIAADNTFHILINGLALEYL